MVATGHRAGRFDSSHTYEVSPPEYAAGLGWIVIVTFSHRRIATNLRAILLPRLTRAGGVLATCLLFFTSLMSVGQVLGMIRGLSWWPVLACSAAISIAVEVIARRSVNTTVCADNPVAGWRASTRFEVFTALGCISAVGWQWTTHVADAFSRGMVQADNLWYHGPFMARFLQTGGFGDLGTLGYPESRGYPFNSELLHSLLAMPFGRDVMVPVANHFFAGLALGASFAIGRRWGVGALAMLATTVVLSFPLVASTQPGQMYNDVMAAALVLAAVALVVEGGLDPRCLAVAGASLGGAIATKVSVLGVAGPLALGVLLVALIARRLSAAVVWFGAVVVTGGFWFIRNWVVHGSPVPFVDIALGPIDFPASLASDPGDTLLETLGDFDVVREYYGESVRISLGPLWYVPVLISVAACAVVVVRTRDWRFLAAGSAAFGFLTYPMLPLTGGLPFVNNLRYAVTALILAMTLSAVALSSRYWARAALAVVCVGCVVTNLVSDHRGRVSAWPGYHSWGFLAATAILGGAWWVHFGRQRGTGGSRLRGIVPASVVAGAVLIGVGWRLQHHYLENRYVNSGLAEDQLYRPFNDVAGADVDVLGTIESFAMFGPDLSNRVTVWNDSLNPARPAPKDPCRFWRGALEPGAGYIVIADGWLLRKITPAQRESWFGTDKYVISLLNDGNLSIYYHDRRLDPTKC